MFVCIDCTLYIHTHVLMNLHLYTYLYDWYCTMAAEGEWKWDWSVTQGCGRPEVGVASSPTCIRNLPLSLVLRRTGVGGKSVFELKPDLERECSPFFYHYTKIDHTKVRQLYRCSQSTCGCYWLLDNYCYRPLKLAGREWRNSVVYKE